MQWWSYGGRPDRSDEVGQENRCCRPRYHSVPITSRAATLSIQRPLRGRLLAQPQGGQLSRRINYVSAMVAAVTVFLALLDSRLRDDEVHGHVVWLGMHTVEAG